MVPYSTFCFIAASLSSPASAMAVLGNFQGGENIVSAIKKCCLPYKTGRDYHKIAEGAQKLPQSIWKGEDHEDEQSTGGTPIISLA
jgi:hypothetical protein